MRARRLAVLAAAVASGALASGALAQAAPAGAPREDLDFLDDRPPKPSQSDPAPATPRAADLPFSAESVRAVVEEHQDEVTGCYESLLAEGRAVQGEVRVRFTIGKSGAVSRAEVERSTVRSPGVERCIVQAVRRWTFPRPAKARSVVFPFRLSVDRAGARDQVTDPPGDLPEDPPAGGAPAGGAAGGDR